MIHNFLGGDALIGRISLRDEYTKAIPHDMGISNRITSFSLFCERVEGYYPLNGYY